MTAALQPVPGAWVSRLLDTTIDHAVIFLDAHTADVVGWMGAAQRLFGHAEHEAIGMPFAALFTPDDLALGLDAQELALARSSGRSEDDRWHVRQDGSRFWASGVLQAVTDEHGAVLALCKVVRDRTDIRTQMVALQNQLALRNVEWERRSRLITSIAHELRNPMMPIFSALQLLRRPLDAGLHERSVEIVERQFGILKKLLDDLNEIARSEYVEPSISSGRVSVQEALRTATEGLMPLAHERGLEMRLVVPTGHIFILADDVRLQQMLLNLIGNAIKYTPTGGHISVSATVEGDMAVIRIEDDGIGILPALLPHIFELFTRERRDLTIPGDGVGLAVVKELARVLGGGVEVRSPGVGKGSVFAVRLPLDSASTLPARPAGPIGSEPS